MFWTKTIKEFKQSFGMLFDRTRRIEDKVHHFDMANQRNLDLLTGRIGNLECEVTRLTEENGDLEETIIALCEYDNVEIIERTPGFEVKPKED